MEYTYKCQKCGEFQVECKITEKAIKECPKCGQPVTRVYKPAAVIWKCSGAFGKSK